MIEKYMKNALECDVPERVWEKIKDTPINTVQSMCKHQTVEIPEITDEIIANAYQAAAQQVIDRNDGSTIQSQTGSLFYDCNTGEYYYKVLTAYHYGTTNAVGAYNFIYNLR